MKKQITMVVTLKTAQRRYRYQGHCALVRVPERVDCEKLSPPARMIAESIHTTERADDLGQIWVTGPSMYDSLVSEGKPEEAEAALRNYGDLASQPQSIVWNFDTLRLDESTEQFFERHVEIMRRMGVCFIRNRAGQQYNLEK